MKNKRRKQAVVLLYVTKDQINNVEMMAKNDKKERGLDLFTGGPVQEEKLRGLEAVQVVEGPREPFEARPCESLFI